MLLKESLARLKRRWRNGLSTGSDAPTRPATPLSLSLISSTIPTRAHLSPAGDIIKEATSVTASLQDLQFRPDPVRENSKFPWSKIESLLGTLESGTEIFGPLHSAVGRMRRFADIFESESKGRKEYEELRENLEGLLSDLDGYMSVPMGLTMTNSVKRLCCDIEAETRILEEMQARNTGRRLMDAIVASDEILACYRRLHEHLKRLTLNANLEIFKTINGLTMEARLAKLSPAMSAIYNSAESVDIKRSGCTPGTRELQTELLLEWARNPQAGRTCWINGMAGTGKTTLAYSVCHRLDRSFNLGASFFCSRLVSECRQVKHIIPSIAYQLARFSVPFRCALVKVLESSPDAHARLPEIQYKELILKPLSQVKGSLPTDFIVVIDALDECENRGSLGRVLDLILSPDSNLPIRFLVSSRPEMEIYRRMMGRVDEQGTARLVLHDLDADMVKWDIESYMRHELEGVPLSDSQWTGLIERCGVLFIYASTACRYIKQGYEMETLNEAVNHIIDSTSTLTGDGDENSIDMLYSTILVAAFKGSGTNEANRTRMKDVLETVICAQEPISMKTLAGLLGLASAKQVDALLKPLRSVLNVAEATGLVTTLHASFSDFMISSDRSTEFHFSQAIRHFKMAEACLQIIDQVEPKFNICALSSSYLLDTEVENLSDRVRLSILPELIYACRHWSAHLAFGEHHDELVNTVRNFLFERLLVWMEVLSLTKNMRFGTNIIREAENWSRKKAMPNDVTRMARDAWEFVSVYANHPMSQSTPHIYVTMLPFWPRSQPISTAYMPRTSGMLEPMGTATVQRRSALLATWTVSSRWVHSMSLSGDGARIVATDGTVPFILDTSTGEIVFTVEKTHADAIQRAAISPDGSRIAFRGTGGTIYVLDVHREHAIITDLSVGSVLQKSPLVFSPNGTYLAFGSSDNIYIHRLMPEHLALGPLEGHTGPVRSIDFSPDGSYVASGSWDKTIRIWDVKTGHQVGKPLRGHTNSIDSVSYSPDGSHLASGSDDGSIRVWDIRTGQTVLGPLLEHSSAVHSVAFSPSGTLVASGSKDGTVRLYDAQTGQTVLGPLEGHTDWVTSVVFSPDNAQLFSCSFDGTIRLWNVQDLDILPDSCIVPNDIRYVRYSPDGLYAVSGSSRGALYVWDIRTGEIALGPIVGHATGTSALDFSPNNAYIASASHDSTLRIWDVLDGKDLHGPLGGHTVAVTSSIRFSPDSLFIASAGSFDETVRVWDVASGQLVIKLDGHSASVTSAAFSPDGLQVVSGSEDRTIRAWDMKAGETVVGPLQGHRNTLCSVEFSPDGSQILSASLDGSIKIWKARTGRRQITCGRYSRTGKVYSAAFSPDGHLFVSGSSGRMIRVWDAESGKQLLALKGHTGPIQTVQFSPDGSHVMSSSEDGTIRFWDIASRRASLQSHGESSQDLDIGDTTDSWSLKDDGWVVDRQQRRLVWVPVDLRIGLLYHPNDSIICTEGPSD